MRKNCNAIIASAAVLMMIMSVLPVMAFSDAGTVSAAPTSNNDANGNNMGYGVGYGIEVLYTEDEDNGYLDMSTDYFTGLVKISIGSMRMKVPVTYSQANNDTIKIDKISSGTYDFTLTGDNASFTCRLKVSNVLATGINLQSSATVPTGESYTLEWSETPKGGLYKSIKWSSSDTSIATVSNGVVYGVKEGNTKITATMEKMDGKNVSATCNLTVKADFVHVTDVTLDKSELEVKRDLTAQLKATVLPENATDKSVIWTSSDDSIATVSSTGLVTGIALGTCVITVTTNDMGKTAICTVTVKINPVIKVEADADGKISDAQLDMIEERLKEIKSVEPGTVPTVELVSKVTSVSFSSRAVDLVKEYGADLLMETKLGSADISAKAIGTLKYSENDTVTFSMKSIESPKKMDGDLKSFKIELTVNNVAQTMNFGEKIIVSIDYQIPSGGKAENVTLWYIPDSGDAVKVDSTYKDNAVTFTTEHLSVYTIQYLASEEPSGNNDNTVLIVVIVIVVAVVIVAAAAYFIMKNKKAKQ